MKLMKTGLMSAILVTTALTPLFFATNANAQSTEKEIAELRAKLDQLEKKLESKNNESSPIKVKWEPAPSISSPDGNFDMNLRGRLYIDNAWVNDANDHENTKATEFRTARLGIEGKAWKNVKYKFEADFAHNEVDVKDAYLQWHGPVAVTVGQFKTANSLEEQTSSRYITFMERASFTDAFDFARQIGVGVGVHGKEYTVNFGVFRGSNGIANQDEGVTVAGRATFGPKIGDTQLHLGASFRYRKQGSDQGDIRYRQRPHAHLAKNRYVATDHIANKDTLFGVEAAAVMGPFSVQGEWAMLKANLSNPAVGQKDPTFSGGYAEVSYMLTGESRAYDAKKGSFQRIKVNNPFFEGGMGAFQVAARFDRIDLTDESFFGGEQDTILLGMNWWLNRHTRFMVNYSHAKIKNAQDVSLSDAFGKNSVNAVGMRAQIDW